MDLIAWNQKSSRSGHIRGFNMSITYLKKATLTSTTNSADVQKTVQDILNDIEAGGDAKALEYAAKFDHYHGNILLTRDEIDAAKALVPEKIKKDIAFAHDNVRRFAEAQRTTFNKTCNTRSITKQKAV